MNLDFSCRGIHGTVEVIVEPNEDPGAVGCELLVPGLGVEYYTGFPMCTATVRYDGRGYASAFGWIQLVRSTDNQSHGRSFELDPLALFSGLSTPFGWFGVKPTLFDAPFRFRETTVTWTAQSFLCVVPTAVVTREVVHVAGFTWGFTLADGEVTLSPAAPLEVGDWHRHLGMLRETFPDWSFRGTQVQPAPDIIGV